MNPVQKKLLALAQKHNLSELGLREIARMIDVAHPQTVKYHLQKLGILPNGSATSTSASPKSAQSDRDFVSIPVYGLANCGPALFFASPTPPEQHLSVSKSILGKNAAHDLYAVRAIGNSLNRADMNGKNIEEGDYVIVNPEDKDFKSGDYVLSLFNDLVNIKRMFKDSAHRQVVLMSESTEEYPPIYVHANDFGHYRPSAKVVEVLKHPKMQDEDISYVYEKLQGSF